MEPSPEATERRSPVSHRAVWVGLVALAVALLLVFGAGYWMLVKYERRAARHIPEDTLVALRVDVEQVVLFEPIRKHVFPMLDGRSPSGTSAGRLTLFKEVSGVNLGMDLREVVWALLPGGDWVFLVGGLFPNSGLPGAIEQVLRRTGNGETCGLVGDTLTCPGLFLAQASDGVLVLASNRGGLASALAEGEWAKRNALPDSPIAAAFPLETTGGPGGELTRRLDQAAVVLRYWGADWLTELRRLTLSTDLGDPLKVELALDGVPAARIEQVRQAVERAQQWASANPGPDAAGERGLLAQLTVEQADGRPILVSTWPRHDVDRAVSRVAELFAGTLGLSAAAAE